MSLADWLFLPKGAQTNEEAKANLARQTSDARTQQQRAKTSEGDGDWDGYGVRGFGGTSESYDNFIANVGGIESTNAAAASGFKEGLSDGAANLGSNLNSTFFGGLGAVLKQIPFFVWLGAAVVLFMWLGGGVWLVRKSKGVLAK